MKKSRYGLLMVLFVSCLTFSAAAGEAPRQLIARIAVKSPALLLSRLDEFVAAATAGRRSELPAGTVTMLATLSLPLSLDSFDAEAPAHILLLHDDGDDVEVAAVLSAPDFTAFIDSLGENIPLTPADDPSPFPSLYTGGGLAVAELPGGKAALFFSSGLSRRLTDFSWLPDYTGDSLVFAEVPLRTGTIAGASDLLRERLDLEQDDILDALRSVHINESAAAGILSLLQDYAPAAIAGTAALESVRLAVDLDAEALTFRVWGRPEPESSIGRAVAGLESAGNLDLTEMERLPASALSVGAVRSVHDLLPSEDLERIIDTVFARILPGLRTDALALLARSRAVFAGVATTTAAFTAATGRRLIIDQLRTPDPAAALAVFADWTELTNRAVEALIDDPAYRFRFVGSPAAGLSGFTEYCLEFADPAAMRQAIEDIDRDELDFAAFERLRVYAGVHGGAFSVLQGQGLTVGDVTDVLALLDAKAPALADGLRARDAIDWLTGAEAALFLMNADSLLPAIVRELAAGAEYASDKEYLEAILEKIPSRPGNGEAMGFAAGVDDGELEVRGYIPVQAVNAFARDWEAFDGGDEDAEAYDDTEPEPEDEEDWSEDDNWQDEDGEEIILDAPADAS